MQAINILVLPRDKSWEQCCTSSIKYPESLSLQRTVRHWLSKLFIEQKPSATSSGLNFLVIHRINLWSPSWCTVCMMTEYLIKWIYNTGNYNSRMITVKSCVYARCTSPKINNNFDLWRLGVNTEDKTMTKTRKPSIRRSNIRVTHNRICQNRFFFFKLDFDITLGLEWSHPVVHVWEKY